MPTLLELIQVLVQPYSLLLAVLGLALFRLRRSDPAGRQRLRLVFVTYLLLLLFSTPLVGLLCLAGLESSVPLPPDRAQNLRPIDAMVVLSSTVLPGNAVRTRATLDGAALDRVHAAGLAYFRGWAPVVLVSGGVIDPDVQATSAGLMAEELVRLGVPRSAILLEERSTATTHDNAVESARILEEKHLGRILLVTDAQHMLRASATFRKQGLEVVPLACRYRTRHRAFRLVDVVPSIEGMTCTAEASNEVFKMALYWVRGWI